MFVLLMIRRPPRFTRPSTLLPYPTLCQSRPDPSSVRLQPDPNGLQPDPNGLQPDQDAPTELLLMSHPIDDGHGNFVGAMLVARNLENGRAHVRTPVTNSHLVCRLQLGKHNQNKQKTLSNYTVVYHTH